ncbi:hypothetical protein EDD86DRAFT_249297 [Gorgonomyces haynaldii]|nr:hypothetical protein EDD86DRAFT_249297 [Gorgonomyces haynaldii]
MPSQGTFHMNNKSLGTPNMYNNSQDDLLDQYRADSTELSSMSLNDIQAMFPQEKLPVEDKYVGGRFTKRELYLGGLVILLNILSLVGAILFIEIGIPMIAQDQVNKQVAKFLAGETNQQNLLKNLKVSVNVGQFTSDSLPISFQATSDPPTSIPAFFGIGPIQVSSMIAQTGMDTTGLADVTVGQMSIKTDQPLNIQNDIRVTVPQDKQQQIQALVQQLSAKGLNDARLIADIKFPFSLMGIPIYQAFPLTVNVPLGQIPNKIDLSAFKSQAVTQKLALTPNQQQLAGQFKVNQIIPLASGFDLVIKNLSIGLRDQGVFATVSTSFSNPFTNISARQRAVHFQFENIALTKDPVQNLDLGVKIDFIDPLIAPGVNGSSFGVAGPFRVTNAAFVEQSTKNLNLPLVIPANALQTLSSSSFSIMGFLNNLTISNINLGTDKSSASVILNLPPLPLPPVQFPYNANLDASNGQQRMLTAGAGFINLVSNASMSQLSITLNIQNLNVPQIARFGGSALGLVDGTPQLMIGNFDFNDGSKSFAFSKQIPLKSLQVPLNMQLPKIETGSLPSIQSLMQQVTISNISLGQKGGSANVLVAIPVSITNSLQFPYSGSLTLSSAGKTLVTAGLSNLAVQGSQSKSKISTSVFIDDLTLDSVSAGASLVNAVFKSKPAQVSVSNLKISDGQSTQVLAEKPVTFNLPTKGIMDTVNKAIQSNTTIDPASILRGVSLQVSDVKLLSAGGQAHFTLTVPPLLSVGQINVPFSAGLATSAMGSNLASVQVSNMSAFGNGTGLVLGITTAVDGISLDSIVGGAALVNGIVKSTPASIAFTNFTAGNATASTPLGLDPLSFTLPKDLGPMIARVVQRTNLSTIQALAKRVKFQLNDVSFAGSAGQASITLGLPSLGVFDPVQSLLATGLSTSFGSGLLSSFSVSNFSLASNQAGTQFSTVLGLSNITLQSIVSGSELVNSVLQKQNTTLQFSGFFAQDPSKTVQLPLEPIQLTLPTALVNAVSNPAAIVPLNTSSLLNTFQVQKLSLSPNGISTSFSVDLPAFGVSQIQLPFGAGLDLQAAGKKLASTFVSNVAVTGGQNKTTVQAQVDINGISLDSIVGGASVVGAVISGKPSAINFNKFVASDQQKTANLPLPDFNFSIPSNLLETLLKSNTPSIGNPLTGLNINQVNIQKDGGSIGLSVALPGLMDIPKTALPFGFGVNLGANNLKLASFQVNGLTVESSNNQTTVGTVLSLSNLNLESIASGAALINAILTNQPSSLSIGDFSATDGQQNARLDIPLTTVNLPPNLLDLALSNMPQNVSFGNTKVDLSGIKFQNGIFSANVNADLPQQIQFDPVQLPFGFGVGFKANGQPMASIGLSNINAQGQNASLRVGTAFAVGNLGLGTIVSGAGLLNSILTEKASAVQLAGFSATDGTNLQNLPLSQITAALPSNLLEFALGFASTGTNFTNPLNINTLNVNPDGASVGFSLNLPGLGQIDPLSVPGNAALVLATNDKSLSTIANTVVNGNVDVRNINLDSVVAASEIISSVLTEKSSALVFKGFTASDGQSTQDLPLSPLTVQLPPNLLDIALSLAPSGKNNLNAFSLSNVSVTQTGASVVLSASLPLSLDLKASSLAFNAGAAFSGGGKQLTVGSLSDIQLQSLNKSLAFQTKVSVDKLSIDTVIGGASLLNAIIKKQPSKLGVNGFFAASGQSNVNLPLPNLNVGVPPNLLDLLPPVDPTQLTKVSPQLQSIEMGQRGPQISFTANVPFNAQFAQVNVPLGFSAGVLPQPKDPKSVANVEITGMSVAGTGPNVTVGATVALNDITLDSAVRFSPTVSALAKMLLTGDTTQKAQLSVGQFAVLDGQKNTGLPLDEVDIPIPPQLIQAITQMAGNANVGSLLSGLSLSNVQVKFPNVAADITLKLPALANKVNLKVPAGISLNAFSKRANLAKLSVQNFDLQGDATQTSVSLSVALNPRITIGNVFAILGLVGPLIAGKPLTVGADNFVVNDQTNSADLPLGRLDVQLPPLNIGDALKGLLKSVFGG